MTEILNLLESIKPIIFVLAIGVALLQLFKLKQEWGAENRNSRLWILGLCFTSLVLVGFSSALGWYRHNYLDKLAGELEQSSTTQQTKQEVSQDRVDSQPEATASNPTATGSDVSTIESAPEFSVTTIDGQQFAIPAPGKVVVVNFFATWCDTCMAELPHLQKIWEQNKDNPQFQLISIGRDETDETVKTFRERYKFALPFASDSRATIVAKYTVEEIPHTFIIGPDGNIALSKIGFEEGDEVELQATVEKALTQSN